MSTYKNVRVLLLQWEDDDLQIDQEVERLAYVFSAPNPVGYNYTTERWSIPSTNSDGDEPCDLLNQRLVKFKRGATQEDLLILYYAGHGGGSPQNLLWSANLRDDSPSLNWHDLQGLLLGCPANVLFILDCCYADLGVTTRGNADNWMLGATTRTDVATGAGYNSFTSTLTRELGRCAYNFYERGEFTSVQSLHSSISRWGRDLVYSPILTRLGDYETAPIIVMPISRPRPRTAHTHPVAPAAAVHASSSNSRSVPMNPRKKESVYAKLRSYDTKFLIDDSASMYGPNWEIVKKAVAAIAPIAVQYDSDGVDVQFFTAYIDYKERQGLRSAKEVMALFDRVEPEGETPTADMLKEELNDYCHRYGQNRHIKGLNLIVLTDGDPSPGQDVTGALVEYARKLAELQAPELKVGVQFVQIGDDEEATKFLQQLDNDLKGSYKLDRDVSQQSQSETYANVLLAQMVDTVLWDDRDQDCLDQKVLLGGILKRVDDNQEQRSSSAH